MWLNEDEASLHAESDLSRRATFDTGGYIRIDNRLIFGLVSD
jgi:hypothetical protein